MNNTIKLDRVAFMTNSGKTTKINVKSMVNEPVNWTSSDESIATVDNEGNVLAQKYGEAIITASTSYDIATCRVTIDYNGQNPVIPPTWGLFIADCEPHVFNDKLYIHGSKDAPDGFMPNGVNAYCTTEYHVIYSEDLINWTDTGVSLDMNDIPSKMLNEAKRLWAPDIFRSPADNKYYLTACTNTRRMIILESDCPEGPFVNPRVITLNGEPINEIDPSVLADDDGKIYLASPLFWVAQLDPNDYSKILPETYRDVTQYMPTDDEPFEGPSLKKRGDTYYYIYIQNVGKKADGFKPLRMVYMTSKNPLGPYTFQGVIVENFNYLNSTNIHGSIVEYRGQWYVAYHMPVAELRRTRTVFMDKLEFNADGTIQQVVVTSSGIKGSFSVFEKIQASGGVVFSGGRGDVRMKARKVPQENPYVVDFVDYPFVFFNNKDEYIGYRYIDFGKGMQTMEITVNTTGDNAVLEFRKETSTGEVISTVQLPNTKGEWETVIATANAQGLAEIYIILTEQPTEGDVKLDWFKFLN